MKNTLVRLLIVCLVTALMLSLSGCDLFHQHDFGKWEVRREATCTEDGKKIRECDCGEEEVKKIAATGSHEYKEEITTNPSCVGDGVKTFTCIHCRSAYTEAIPTTTYTATEIYEKHLNSIGEILTYDKYGYELALGTGFVLEADGTIVTNYHVIEGAYAAQITINGTDYEIEQVLAYDTVIDAALLKVNATNLTPVTICKQTHKVGETVYAFGSSLGMTSTLSDGMITFTDREVDGVIYIQHDAPISSGNSGGPLINRYGEVIGINTWTYLDSQNLNFAIKISELDHLENTTPMSFEEVAEKEYNPFGRLRDYLIGNGTVTDDGWYAIEVDNYTSADGSYEFTQYAYYIPEYDVISLDFIIGDAENWAYFEIDSQLSGAYYWRYFDTDNNEMTGTLQAATFTEYSLLPYDDYTAITGTVDEIQDLASNMLIANIQNINVDWEFLGITAADLGFCFF